MSIFTETATTVEDKNYLEELVGEGKKFADTEALARGKAESDAFIAQLTKENAELRERNQTLPSLQSLIDKISAERTTPDRTNEDNQDREPDSRTEKQPVEVEALVEKVIEKRANEAREIANQARTVEVLQANFGPGYAAIVAAKAKELGVGVAFLEDLAKTQPKALFTLVGATETPRPATNPAQPARGLPSTARGEKKNFAYYEKIRKSNPNLYNSLPVHNEMLRQLAEQGDDFYA